LEPVVYPKPELEQVLGKTLGVPLFQEQAMRVAIVCAGFTPGEADQLRKSMATFKHTGGVSAFRDKLITGMVANGYEQRFAEQTFKQLEGFRGVAASIREIPPHSDGGEHDRGAWPHSARGRGGASGGASAYRPLPNWRPSEAGTLRFPCPMAVATRSRMRVVSLIRASGRRKVCARATSTFPICTSIRSR
jgi:hypothetical protein